MNLFIGNISEAVTRDELFKEFSKFGKCEIEYFRRFAFCSYIKDKHAARAVKAWNGKGLKGSNLKVEFSCRKSVKPKRSRTPSPEIAAQSVNELKNNKKNLKKVKKSTRDLRNSSADITQPIIKEMNPVNPTPTTPVNITIIPSINLNDENISKKKNSIEENTEKINSHSHKIPNSEETINTPKIKIPDTANSEGIINTHEINVPDTENKEQNTINESKIQYDILLTDEISESSKNSEHLVDEKLENTKTYSDHLLSDNKNPESVLKNSFKIPPNSPNTEEINKIYLNATQGNLTKHIETVFQEDTKLIPKAIDHFDTSPLSQDSINKIHGLKYIFIDEDTIKIQETLFKIIKKLKNFQNSLVKCCVCTRRIKIKSVRGHIRSKIHNSALNP
jgi:RNA recognition motif. (a.k.a. RRM, RBD, or RNP domain)